jgi:phosphoglycolate phosphatase/putative hydrolase of the HAD superfamily
MKVYSLPPSARALLLDFDSTLYTNPAYASFQNEVLIARLARERGESVGRTKARLDELKSQAKAAGAGATSLGNLFLELGVPIETSVAWREELIEPAAWLKPDPALAEAIVRLGRRFALAIVTNNPASVGRKGLEALGLTGLMSCVVGLDDTLRSKPDTAPYALAAKRLNVAAPDCVSVGDRYDVDLAPALALGMGAILVDGVEDVRELPAYLEAALPHNE